MTGGCEGFMNKQRKVNKVMKKTFHFVRNFMAVLNGNIFLPSYHGDQNGCILITGLDELM